MCSKIFMKKPLQKHSQETEPPHVGCYKIWASLVIGVFMTAMTAWGQGQGWVGTLDYATPYTFTTIAGSSTNFGNVDGMNGKASFDDPQGLTIDTNGNLYVVDATKNTVRKVTPAGTNWSVITIVQASASLNGPVGITIDASNNLYVADTLNNVIRKITPVGANWVVTTIAGTNDPNHPFGYYADGTNGGAQFAGPNGIVADPAGNLYVADTENNVIRKITPVGTNWVVTTIVGNTNNFLGDYGDGTNQDASFAAPTSIAVDSFGNLFVTDLGNEVIRKVMPMGTNWIVTTVAGLPEVPPDHVDGTNSDAQFYGPYGITVDANDNLYVSDTYNNLIRKITPMGTNWVVTTLAGDPNAGVGASDGTGTNATFNQPWGIAVDAGGNVYVADAVNHEIRKGFVQVLTLPNLTIGLTGLNNVVVSWPGTFGLIQTNADLTTTNWGYYGGTVSTSNGTNSVTFTPGSGNLFFRLSN